MSLSDRSRVEVTADWNPCSLCFSLCCRFVSRIFVVPDHPELLLSSSGVSVLLCHVPLWVPV